MIKKINPKLLLVLKIVGFCVLVLFVLVILFGLVNGRNLSIDRGGWGEHVGVSSAPSSPGGAIMRDGMFNYGLGSEMPQFESGVESDAEDFEVTDYSATIRTRDLNKTCSAISDLKPLSYVIFENVNEGTDSCFYSFKVGREHVPQVLGLIEDFKPESLDQNTRTIKKVLEDFASERDILERKIKAIDETFASATKAYDEVTAIASRGGDANSLALAITSRVEMIERLSSERIKLAGQLERILRSESEALERIDYSQFNVNVYESKYFDGKRLGDSWRDSLREFFYSANRALIGLTIGFISIVLSALPFLLYALVFVFVLKYIIRFARYIWRS